MPIKNVLPNAITWLRFGIGCALLVLMFFPHPFWLAQFFMLAGIISDKLDGSLARAWHVESERGKKMESFVDPFFLTSSGVYFLFARDLPLWFFLTGFTLAVAVNVLRLGFAVKSKKIFYKKSPLTRAGVGVGYLVMLCYIFTIPYREWLLVPASFLGIIVTLNYLRLFLAAGYFKSESNRRRVRTP